jgi:hypothetical protein
VRCERRCAGEDMVVMRYIEATARCVDVVEGLPGKVGWSRLLLSTRGRVLSSPEKDA